MDSNIQNNLKTFRKERSLSQEDLAEALGVSRQSVIALEQGKYMPSLPLVVSICNFFNSAFEDLFEFEHQMDEEFDKFVENHPTSLETASELPSSAQGYGMARRGTYSEISGNGIKIKAVDNLDKNINSPDSLVGPDPSTKLGAGKEANMPFELEPWRPFRESVSLRDAMDRLFEESVVTPVKTGITMPKIDIKEKKDAVVVKAEIPGVLEEDVEVEITDNIMTISGEKKEEKEEDKDGYHYQESHSGSFSRSFSLPSEVAAEKAEAEVKNGILTIVVPKVEAKKPKKVTIKKKTK